MRCAKVIILALALASSVMAATPKAYLRGPTEAKIDQPIFLKFNGTVSDEPIHIEQVSGPEEVALGYWFDQQGKPIYAVGTASIPGQYRFSLIAEGVSEGATKATRSYAFWDVDVLGDEDETDDHVEGVTAPAGIIRLTIGKPSQQMKLSRGQKLVRFSFTPKSRKVFRVATAGDGAWTMELAGPNDASNVFAVDSLHSGPGGNAQITRNLPPGGTYYVKVKPLEPYLGKPFRVLVTAHDTNPEPDLVPIPEPSPTPTPEPPPKPQPEPVPTGELKVLYLYESSRPLTRGQDLVWYSPVVDEALTKLTSPGPDRVPGWRKYDIDTDVSNESTEWQEMMATAKAELAKPGALQLPVVAVFRGGKGRIYPLPSTPQELLSLIQK